MNRKLARNPQQALPDGFGRPGPLILGKTQPPQPVQKVVGEHDDLKISVIGDEAARGNLLHVHRELELLDHIFDVGPAIIKSPDSPRFASQVSHNDLVAPPLLWKKGHLPGGLLLEPLPDDHESARPRPADRRIFKFGLRKIPVKLFILKAINNALDRLGLFGDNRKLNPACLAVPNKLNIIEPTVSSQVTTFGPGGPQGIFKEAHRIFPGMNVSGSQTSRDKVFLFPQKGADGMITRPAGLGRVVSDGGAFLMSVNRQDRGVHVDDHALAGSNGKHLSQIRLVHPKDGGDMVLVEPHQEPPKTRGIREGLKARDAQEGPVASQNIRMRHPLEAEKDRVDHAQEELAGTVVAVPFLNPQELPDKPSQPDLSEKLPQKINTGIRGDVFVFESKLDIALQRWKKRVSANFTHWVNLPATALSCLFRAIIPRETVFGTMSKNQG